ncbi:selenide, water dikinase SelD [Proteinivorax tanatarense]|uniref:Selenide, water dikinase n=1 Tax=Proteinivorax tanatarense TaxID=1260629 RepID=A0AAU7VQI7_9FIRM
MGPGDLQNILDDIKFEHNDDLIVGYHSGDDAAVFRVPQNKLVVQTVDFFTPMVDDPFIFGKITAANALSDVYAMGGDPKYALNLVGFPMSCLPKKTLAQILAGGSSVLKEAGVTLAGGHSIEDPEPKYGLSVTGFVSENGIWKNTAASPDEHLILTKPLGTGVITTALKGDMASEQAYNKAVSTMAQLNKKSKEVLSSYDIKCCTDITGFGLGGHCAEIAMGSKVDITINNTNIPIIEEALEYAQFGLIPAGAYRNKEHFSNRVSVENTVPQEIQDIIFDPQTSGGLLFSCSKEKSDDIVYELQKNGVYGCIIGITSKGEGNITII